MTLIAFFLVLASAILHAGWNILSKRSNPSAAFYLLSSSTAAVVCLCCAGGFRIDFTLLPLKFSLLLTVSILFEALYLIGLAHASPSCDISIAACCCRRSNFATSVHRSTATRPSCSSC